MDCNRCELRGNCGQVVWGVGEAPSDVALVGEYPSAEDDLIGEPFQGRAGDLLRKAMRGGGLEPASCFATHAVKCKPPHPPKKAFVNACRGWLWQELSQVQPKVVVTLGRLPARLLLGFKASFDLEVEAGRFHTVPYAPWAVAVWHGVAWQAMNGKKADREAAAFWKRVKEKVDATAQEDEGRSGSSAGRGSVPLRVLP